MKTVWNELDVGGERCFFFLLFIPNILRFNSAHASGLTSMGAININKSVVYVIIAVITNVKSGYLQYVLIIWDS